MNGYPTKDVEVFITRLKLLRYYEGKLKECLIEIDQLENPHYKPPSQWGISVPYGETEIIDGKPVVIKYKNEFYPPGGGVSVDAILWRLEELETMSIQYKAEIEYLYDILDDCSEVVKTAAIRRYADKETWEKVADSIPMNYSALKRRILNELEKCLKGLIKPKKQ